MKEGAEALQEGSALVSCLPWAPLLGLQDLTSAPVPSWELSPRLGNCFCLSTHEEAEARRLKSGCPAFWLRAPAPQVRVGPWLLPPTHTVQFAGLRAKARPKATRQFLRVCCLQHPQYEYFRPMSSIPEQF